MREMIANMQQLAARLSGWVASWPTLAQSVVIALILVPVYNLIEETSRVFWFTPQGLRFTPFLLLPRRLWFAVLTGLWLSMIVHEWYVGSTWKNFGPTLQWPFAIFPQPLAVLLAVWTFRRKVEMTPPDSPLRMGLLLGCMLFAAILASCCDALYGWSWVWSVGEFKFGLLNLAIASFTGNIGGTLMIAPLVLALCYPKALSSHRALLLDGLFGLALPLALIAWLNLVNADPMTGDYSRVLVLLPALYIGYRYGWRGAAVSISLIGLALAPIHIGHWDAPNARATTHMLFALGGMAALLLGAAMDAQRDSNMQVAMRNLELRDASVALRDAAQRNLRMEEEQRRRIAAEIHDELGQNLTAVHTRIKLAADRLNAAQLGDVTTSIYEILATMRGSVRGLMDSLRPPVLDEFGLVRALREGPLRDLVERAGLRYEFDLRGDPALIAGMDETMQIAIWRIVQEAATNCVRHAHATCFRARLRVGMRDANALAILDLRDDGIGITDVTVASRGGHGLQGMRDRALALNGLVRVSSNRTGTRLRVLLRQAI